MLSRSPVCHAGNIDATATATPTVPIAIASTMSRPARNRRAGTISITPTAKTTNNQSGDGAARRRSTTSLAASTLVVGPSDWPMAKMAPTTATMAAAIVNRYVPLFELLGFGLVCDTPTRASDTSSTDRCLISARMAMSGPPAGARVSSRRRRSSRFVVIGPPVRLLGLVSVQVLEGPGVGGS